MILGKFWKSDCIRQGVIMQNGKRESDTTIGGAQLTEV